MKVSRKKKRMWLINRQKNPFYQNHNLKTWRQATILSDSWEQGAFVPSLKTEYPCTILFFHGSNFLKSVKSVQREDIKKIRIMTKNCFTSLKIYSLFFSGRNNQKFNVSLKASVKENIVNKLDVGADWKFQNAIRRLNSNLLNEKKSSRTLVKWFDVNGIRTELYFLHNSIHKKNKYSCFFHL